MSRADAYFGDNHTFNQTVFDEVCFPPLTTSPTLSDSEFQFINFSNRLGGGKYNLTVASELRLQRIHDSIATNPEFQFTEIRFNTAYFTSVFPLLFFIDGRQTPAHLDGQLDVDAATSFFRDGKFPDGFWRTSPPQSPTVGSRLVLAAHPVPPGRNQGKVNSYVTDPKSATLTTPCVLYSNFVNNVVVPLYPRPTGDLRDALNRNLGFMFQFLPQPNNCTRPFPFGK